MPHTQLAKVKLASKPGMLSFVDDELKPELDTHPLLKAKLDASLKQWQGLIDTLPDDPPSAGPAPQKDSYLVPALVQANEKAADDYFASVDIYALAVAEEVPGSLMTRVTNTLASRRQIMEGANTAYQMAFLAYQKALDTFQAARKDLPARSQEYNKQLYLIRGLLNNMIETFNADSKYDEELYQSEVDYFCSMYYEKYVPTHSFFNNASGGTLYYDFRNNRFQLHIHIQKNGVKSQAVRVKLYGQEQGAKRDGAWGLVQHFMDNYTPNWNGAPARC
jgi:hypothetical protein